MSGSCSVVIPAVCPRPLFSIFTNGVLQLSFGWLNGDEKAWRAREKLHEAAGRMGLTLSDVKESGYTTYKPEAWLPSWTLLLELVQELGAE